MIRIKGVNKYFGNTQVLKNINVEINKGEIFGLVGHSGAGKSIAIGKGLVYTTSIFMVV